MSLTDDLAAVIAEALYGLQDGKMHIRAAQAIAERLEQVGHVTEGVTSDPEWMEFYYEGHHDYDKDWEEDGGAYPVYRLRHETGVQEDKKDREDG